MSERLSDTALENLDAYLDVRSRGAIGLEVRQALRGMIAELRERRLSDQRGRVGMTAEDKEALRWLVRHVNATTMPGVRPRRDKAAALAALDRLLKDTP